MTELESKRALSLDALRGFAILTMVLSGIIPFGVLPSWMYHAQIPPPEHIFNPNLPGITWVDLVFPFFLFALGAAIPLALNKRFEKGSTNLQVIRYIFERTLLLGFFALIHRALNPHTLNSNPNAHTWFTALLAFIAMFFIFLRTPANWSRGLSYGIKISGWLAVIIMLLTLRYPDGSGFSLYRSNIILIVLTNTYFFGSLIYLATRNNWYLRLGILGVLIALRLANPLAGWVQTVWNWTPIPWMYKLYYCQYLFIVIPGTIIGDLFLKWQKMPTENSLLDRPYFYSRMVSLTFFMLLFIPIMLVGLKMRLVTATVLLSLVILAICAAILAKPATEIEKFLRTLFYWGGYWLILGLIFEPYEGGIKKDPPTLSYYFVTTGLAIFLVIAFTIIIDIYKKQNWLQLLINNGQNPMIAYTAMANFIMPILSLTTLHNLFVKITPTPWLGALRGLIYTIILALFVSYCTKRRWFWRT